MCLGGEATIVVDPGWVGGGNVLHTVLLSSWVCCYCRLKYSLLALEYSYMECSSIYLYKNDSWKAFICSDNLFLCRIAAKVALVKCRDLHWAMMAHRDQRDVSLSSLRMLIVTDGANPCEYAHSAVTTREVSQRVVTICSNWTLLVVNSKKIKVRAAA